MFKNYLKIAFRNFNRNRGFSFLNIFGLTVGIACSILILLWVHDELSYDTFHVNSDNIYRILQERKSGDENVRSPRMHGALKGAILSEIPEVVTAARFRHIDEIVVKRGDINCIYDVDVLDVLSVVNHILDNVPLMGKPLERADCNVDGQINITDVVGITNVILGTGTCAP